MIDREDTKKGFIVGFWIDRGNEAAEAMRGRSRDSDCGDAVPPHMSISCEYVVQLGQYLNALTSAGEGGVPVGEAGSMPGTDGFTMAAFEAKDVPIGTKLYAAPHPTRQDGAREGEAVSLPGPLPWSILTSDEGDPFGAAGAWVDANGEVIDPHEVLAYINATPAPDEAVEAEREALCKLLYQRLPPEYCDPIISEIRARSRRDVGSEKGNRQ